MRHLLPKGLNCWLDESLLSVYVEMAITFVGDFTESADSANKQVVISQIFIAEATKRLCDLRSEGSTLSIELKEVAVGVPSDIAHLI